MPAAASERIPADKLRAFAVATLGTLGMPDDDAATTADAMVWADLRGAHQHGVTARLSGLAGRVRSGNVNVRPVWKTVHDAPSFTLLDADGAWGQVAGTRGMQAAIAKARTSGAAITVVRNAEITAALGWYASVAIRERMIGMAINNSVPLMPAWGGAERAIGNQAFAVGAPAQRNGYLLFDSTVAALSLNAVERMKERGEQLPAGAAVDAHGQPTTDPEEAIAGLILPMAGHRGYGLALAWEILTGVLSGGGTPAAASAKPMGISMFLMAIDPTRSQSYDEFTERVDVLIERMRNSRPARAGETVRVPGERGHRLEIEYAREGIPLTIERIEKLRTLGGELGVAW
jgi:LDH2 family malate/lactate/ureidoglycolate dehydrogenase